MDSIIVCPFCHKGFRDSLTECPACSEIFSSKDWPVPLVSSPGNRRSKLFLKWDDNEWSPSPRTTEFYIGREPDSDGLQLDFPTVSRKHARIRLTGDGVWCIDRVEKEDGQQTSVRIRNAGTSSDSGEDIRSETPLSTKDIITIEPFRIEVSVDYAPDLIFDTTHGEAQSEEIALNREEPVYLGSDGDICRCVIRHAAPAHAVVYYQKKLDSWWIADCNTASGTKVNGVQIRNEKLEDLDKITIAGVDIVFDGGTILVDNGDVLGVDVLVQGVSVAKKGRDILKDITFYAEPGEFIGILGPSGCGKSSLIQRLVGLGGFDRGEVRINSVPYLENKEDIQSVTAYIPQDVALHDTLTVKEEMEVFGKLHLAPGSDSEKKYADALNRVHLDGKENSRVGELSGGEKRRLSIALELLRAPHLLCLDEPTAGLDPATETDIMMLLRRIANQSRTVLCSTHIMGNIRLFDKVLFLARGRTLFFGTPSELMNHFSITSPLQLYRKFGKGTVKEQIERAEIESRRYMDSSRYKKYQLHESKERSLPPHSAQAGFIRQVNGYFLRQIHVFLSFLHGKDFPDGLRQFLTSAAFIQMILQPILVALVLKLACADDFLDPIGHRRLYFFFSIAIFWLGLNGAIRELVKERTPWRCLERLAHIPMSSYLLSKIIWVQLLCAIQVAVFSFCIFGLPRFPILASDGVAALPFMWLTVFALYSICSLGAWIALAVSAFFKKENAAVGLLPIILIPVLFFSEPIINDDTFDHDFFPEYEASNGHFSKVATDLERFMPGFAPEVLLDRTENGRGTPATWLIFFGMLSSYMLITMGIIILCQGNNERQWEGR